jgi:choline kinase
MSFVSETAVLLAAGMGVRMRPLTDGFPKCMASVGGVTIIENALSVMGGAGVKKTVIVCGYKAEVLMEHCKKIDVGMEVDFLINPLYERTNSMYSLKLALDAVKVPCWVLEGDVFFKGDVLSAALDAGDQFFWLGDSGYRASGGAFLKTDSVGVLTDVSILPSASDIEPGMLKSAGILGLNADAVSAMSDWLRGGVSQNKVSLYYDLIIAEHLHELPIKVLDVSPAKWMEIDTVGELMEAERLFQKAR